MAADLHSSPWTRPIGLAVLAYQPGGVTFAGLHWCTDHGQCKAAAQAAAQEETPR